MLTNSNTSIDISVDMQKVLKLALNLSTLSDGLFDVSIAPVLVMDKQLPNHLQLNTDQNFIETLGNYHHLKITDN